MTRIVRRAAFIVLALTLAAPEAGAETPASEKPEPPLELLLDHGRTARAARPMPGLEHRLVEVPGFGVTIIHIFAFDQRRFGLRTAVQRRPTGSRASDFLTGPDDVFAIDGGYFERDRDGRLSPSGLLVVDGVLVGEEHERAGSGILHSGGDGLAISYRKEAPPPEHMASAVQVGPILVDPGGKVGIYSNQRDRRRRSALCLRPGEIVAVVVHGDGLSLYQLAHVLATAQAEGGVGCDVAINLDGGPSTQAVLRTGAALVDVPGETTVHNALVISPAR